MRTERTSDRLLPTPRGQAGSMLVEVLLSLMLGGLLLAGFLSWGLVTMNQQSSVRSTNTDTFGLGLGSVHIPQDVASSLTGVTQVDENGADRSDGDIRDCSGGAASGGEVLIGLVTPAHRRIVYVLVPSSETPGTQELWRRECPNYSEPSDATLNDPTLNAPAGVNPGAIDPSTTGNEGSSKRMSKEIISASTDCPTDGGGGQDPGCRTVSLTADVLARSVDVVVKATRRTNNYAPPGTAPIPRFTFEPNPPQRNDVVTFDATTSSDPVGGTLTYSWDFGDGTTSSSGPIVTHSYPDLTTYTVSLNVTNSAGTTSATPAIRTVTVEPKDPTAAFLGVPLTATKHASKNFALSLMAHEGTLANYSIDWGDGSTSGPHTGCAGTAAETACTPTEVHTFTDSGSFIVRLEVADSLGNERTVLASVTVGSGVLYVKENGSPDAGCGSSGLPCAEIQQGLNEAQSQGKTTVLVTEGDYERFDVRSGIDIEGGYSADFQSQSGTTSVTASFAYGQYSAMRADNSSSASISNLTFVGPSLAYNSSNSAQAVVVRNGTLDSHSGVGIDGGEGPDATGLLVEGGSTVTLHS
ncbi:MAG: PKD domain-containing protein [Microthrixaceae bacterium]|nr:PKD domain-containing protein [Microthrixaceae bacterium]